MTSTNVGTRPAFSVDVKGGVVSRHRWASGKERETVWVDCINCGPQPPFLGEVQSEGQVESWVLTRDELGTENLICSQCGNTALKREVRIPDRDVDRHESCNQKCLRVRETKLTPFCACGCRGRCHGIGVCSCKEKAHA